MPEVVRCPQGTPLNGSVREPLLTRETSGTGRGAAPQTLIGLVLPCLAGAVVHAAERICFYQKVAAVALCCYSMVEPSVLSAGPQLCQQC